MHNVPELPQSQASAWVAFIPLRTVLASLSMNRRTLGRAIARKEFPEPLRLGGQLLWPREALDAWFESQKGGLK